MPAVWAVAPDQHTEEAGQGDQSKDEEKQMRSAGQIISENKCINELWHNIMLCESTAELCAIYKMYSLTAMAIHESGELSVDEWESLSKHMIVVPPKMQ
jgi:hypothetical protein